MAQAELRTKTCSKCKAEKSTADFGFQKTTKDGLRTWCKSCLHEYVKKWRAAHPDVKKAHDKKYRATHLAAEKERHRKYRAEHREASRESL